MKITDAQQATEVARKLIGNPPYFKPIEGKMVNGIWNITAEIGTLDRIVVTVKLPEGLAL